MMTEAYANMTFTMKYYQSDAGAPIAHFPFNFVMIENLRAESTAVHFKETIDYWLDNLPAGKTSNWVLGNHDKPRYGTRYGSERIDGLMALTMTLPGVAVTYNGEEIGMVDNQAITWDETVDPQACNADESEYQWRSRDPTRAPFQWDTSAYAGFSTAKPWLPINQNYLQLNLASQQAAERSHYKFYKQLVALRNEHTFHAGGFRSHAFGDNVFAHARELADHETFVVLINFSGQAQTVNVTSFVSDLNSEVSVALAGSKSNRVAGDRVTTDSVVLNPYDIIIVRSSASTMAVSALALALAVIVKSFL
jgi:alpha-glucosidase